MVDKVTTLASMVAGVVVAVSQSEPGLESSYRAQYEVESKLCVIEHAGGESESR